MRLRLLPFDPADALLTAVASLIRLGIPGWSSSPQPQPSWPLGDACPADHYFAPEKTKLFLSTDPGKIEKTPVAIILKSPEDLREKAEVINGAWALHLWADVRCHKDVPTATPETLIQCLLALLTQPLKLDDNTIQQPQTRLNTARLHLFGSTHRDNFEETAHGHLGEDEHGYPTWRFGTRITCALYGNAE